VQVGPAITRREQEGPQWTIRRINPRCPREWLEYCCPPDHCNDKDSTNASV
jgi:hypothetical protein